MSHVTAPAFLTTNGQVEVLAHAWCADAAGAAGTLAGPIGVGLAVDTTTPAARAGSLAAGDEALQELQHGRVRRGAWWGLGAWGGAGWGRLFLLGLFQFAVLCRSVRGGPADAARGWRELAECAVPCVGVAAEVRQGASVEESLLAFAPDRAHMLHRWVGAAESTLGPEVVAEAHNMRLAGRPAFHHAAAPLLECFLVGIIREHLGDVVIQNLGTGTHWVRERATKK